MNKCDILGISFSSLRLCECIEVLADWVKSNRGAARWIACVNPHSHEVSRRDSEFLNALRSADMVTADGTGIVIASKILGGTIRERVCGPDIFPMLCTKLNLEQPGVRMFFLGTSDENLAALAAKFASVYPNLVFAGSYAPPFRQRFSEEESQSMADRINNSGAEILWVGLGAPKQEKWTHQNIHQLRVKLVGPVGGVFDFFTGRVKLPPMWMQKLGLIWLFRLCQEPRRLWRRNLDGFIFLGRVIWFRISRGRARSHP